MEFYKANNLYSCFFDLSVDESLVILKQIVKAMLYANLKEVIHGNLTPSKILINNGIIKVSGFELNNIKDIYDLSVWKIYIIAPIGLFHYSSPEIMSRETYDTKCDVWSVGMIFYQMIFKKLPWKAGSSSPFQLCQNIKNEELTFEKNIYVDADIIDLIKNMLEIEKEKRFSFKQVIDHIALQREIPDILKKNKKLNKNKKNRE